jgi:MFS family permease
MYCKADDVQSKLAMIRGWQATFDGLPSLVLALPIGWAGDRYGRKPVLLAGLLAFVLSAAWKELV